MGPVTSSIFSCRLYRQCSFPNCRFFPFFQIWSFTSGTNVSPLRTLHCGTGSNVSPLRTLHCGTGSNVGPLRTLHCGTGSNVSPLRTLHCGTGKSLRIFLCSWFQSKLVSKYFVFISGGCHEESSWVKFHWFSGFFLTEDVDLVQIPWFVCPHCLSYCHHR